MNWQLLSCIGRVSSPVRRVNGQKFDPFIIRLLSKSSRKRSFVVPLLREGSRSRRMMGPSSDPKYMKRVPVLASTTETSMTEIPTHCPGCGAEFQGSNDKKAGFLVKDLFLTQERPLKKYQYKKLSANTLSDEEFKEAVKQLSQDLRKEFYMESDDVGHEDTSDDEVNTNLSAGTPPSPTTSPPQAIPENLKTLICQRCFYLINYNDITTDWKSDVTTDRSYLKFLKGKHNAVIVKVFDIADFPHSFLTDLDDFIGKSNPLILAANKSDLLPQSHTVNLARIKMWLRKEMQKMGIRNSEIHIISAKSGDGISNLMQRIASLRAPMDDVYLVGSANVGKSALFNAMLRRGSNIKRKVTTSPVPGTTIGMIGMPLLTFGKQFLKKATDGEGMIYDTPGIVNTDHLLRLLEFDEIQTIKYSGHIKPVTFELEQGQSLFLGAFARFDILAAASPILATIFTSIPPHITTTEKADNLLAALYAGNSTILFPLVSSTSSRLLSFPRLIPAREFEFAGYGRPKATLDVSVSGAGWVSLAGVFETAKVRVSSPDGKGVVLRDPPMLPYEFKGSLRKFFGDGRRVLT